MNSLVSNTTRIEGTISPCHFCRLALKTALRATRETRGSKECGSGAKAQIWCHDPAHAVTTRKGDKSIVHCLNHILLIRE